MNFDRMRALSGQNSKQSELDQLNVDRQQIVSEFDAAIYAVKNGKQIDEGFFTSLKAAFQTAAKLGKDGTGAVVDKVKKASASVKAIYQDKKAQAELKTLFKQLKTIIDKFDEISNSAPTIFKNDKQVALEMDYFRRVMNKMIQTLGSRLAIQEGVIDVASIEKLLKEAMAEEAAINVATTDTPEIEADSTLESPKSE